MTAKDPIRIFRYDIGDDAVCVVTYSVDDQHPDGVVRLLNIAWHPVKDGIVLRDTVLDGVIHPDALSLLVRTVYADLIKLYEADLLL